MFANYFAMLNNLRMDIIRILLTGLLSTLLLTSCTSMQTAPELPQNQSVSWDKRTKALARITTWNLKGAIAIRSLTKNSNWSASWQWQQTGNTYSITLVAPLGSGTVTLTGAPAEVTLATSDGKQFTSASAEALLEEQLGWRLPVSNLRYWVRGLPVPNETVTKQFDEYHHISQMRQGNWFIQYVRYTSVQNIDVPSKIYLNNPDLNVKIVINQWQL